MNLFPFTSLIVIIVVLKSLSASSNVWISWSWSWLPFVLEIGLHFLPYLHTACYEWLLWTSNCEASVFCYFSQMSGFFCFSRQLTWLDLTFKMFFGQKFQSQLTSFICSSASMTTQCLCGLRVSWRCGQTGFGDLPSSSFPFWVALN